MVNEENGTAYYTGIGSCWAHHCVNRNEWVHAHSPVPFPFCSSCETGLWSGHSFFQTIVLCSVHIFTMAKLGWSATVLALFALLPFAASQSFLPANSTFSFPTPLSIYDSTFPDYISAMCIEPSKITIDQCFVGDYNWTRCPNTDVAGILVRVSTYLANFLLGIILMYSPEDTETSVWAQLLTVYSLLVSGVIAIGNTNLSRFHSEMTIFLVMSPLSTSLFIYAILGLCGRKHRLDNILSGRREHLLPRLLVITYVVLSVAILLFNSSATESHFAPNPCDLNSAAKATARAFNNLLFIPYAGLIPVVIFAILAVDYNDGFIGAVAFAAMLPFLLIVISFVCGIVRQRHRLAKEFREQNNRWKIWVTWDVLAEQYPFMHFCGVFFIPMIYWVLVNELQTLGTPDNLFSLSFGQVLAVFVVLPPLWQVIQMAPKARGWFMNLRVVCFVTGRPKVTPLVRVYSLEDGVAEKNASTAGPSEWMSA
ncbi:hypothetical protein MSAN_01064200 [Mycena sanguinolenta]|uniref:Uncharacterized protein n=1 Tax=Mycena sanguinolenta TaxID=230812 RepID=A0A8H6YSZ6_9AGAR|nr:hypothetical protein MSAN_01064200 [Mycena sanguinolenta]